MKIEIGKKSPKFSGLTDSGGRVSSEELLGKYVVLYFYPKDDTSTCTVEACGFNEQIDQITELGAEVIGVSPDTPSKHDKFIAKYNLKFRLLSDPDLKISKSFGVWGDKVLFGVKYKGIIRTTFIISPKGKIVKIFPKVIAKKHAGEIIEALKELQKNN